MTPEGHAFQMTEEQWNVLNTIDDNYVDRISKMKSFLRLRDFFVQVLELDQNEIPEANPDKIVQ